MLIAADLLPWWFAAGFWLVFVALLAVVVRDIRRMGGPRRILAAVRRHREERARGGDVTGDEG